MNPRFAMTGNHPPRRPGDGLDSPGRPSHDDREQKARARQAAEALFAPKPPTPVIEQRQADPQVRQSRILKTTSPPAARPPVTTAATPKPTAPASIPPPHVARIRSWLKYGMTIAQVAEAYRIPITEIKRLLSKP